MEATMTVIRASTRPESAVQGKDGGGLDPVSPGLHQLHQLQQYQPSGQDLTPGCAGLHQLHKDRRPQAYMDATVMHKVKSLCILLTVLPFLQQFIFRASARTLECEVAIILHC